MKPSFLLLLGLILPPHALPGADDPVLPNANARLAGTFTFYFENDYFGGTDRHYSNGLKFSWLSSDLVDWGQQGWRRSFVADLDYGCGIIAGPWQLTFTQVYRTREFETQPHKYNEFGSVTLSRTF